MLEGALAAPNPSLHPTRYSGLRPLPRAGELKRWAAQLMFPMANLGISRRVGLRTMLLLLAAGGIFLGSIHTSFANGDCNTALEPDGQATPRQQRRLPTFGLVVFSPPLPGYGLQSSKFSRRDLIKRFGRPLRSRSWERLPYDPYDPMEVISIWEYSGMILTTGASKPKPNILWMEKIEILDANIALQFGLRVGQPLDRWVRLFGPPGFSKEKPCAAYGGQYYFSCGPEKDIACVASYSVDLLLDNSKRVQRISFSHGML